MSRYSGRQTEAGSTKFHGSKGVANARRTRKREEAEARDSALPQDSPKRRKNRTSAARLIFEGGG